MKIDFILGRTDDYMVDEIRKRLDVQIMDAPRPDEVIISLTGKRAGAFCIGVVRSMLPPKVLGEFDFLVSPFAYLVEYCRTRGFYCIYAPISVSKVEKSMGKKLGVPVMTEEILYRLDKKALVLRIEPTLEDWASALNLPIEIWKGSEADFFSEVRECFVSHFDDYYAIMARGYGISCTSIFESPSFQSWKWDSINSCLDLLASVRDKKQGFTVIK